MKGTWAGCAAMGLASLAVLTAGGSAAAAAPAAVSHPVIVIGIAGLRWSDISASATPVIWRFAAGGSVGSLITTTVHTTTCPDDAWLTLNAGNRAAEPAGRTLRCPPVPVLPVPGHPAQAKIPAMGPIVRYNAGTGYGPRWGGLLTAAGLHRCATAVGRGAALALADSAGRVGGYLPALPPGGAKPTIRRLLTECPLTVIDLGNLPATAGRATQVAADDRQVRRIVAAAPPDAVIALAGLGDDTAPHLRAIVVTGAGYRAGGLTSDATRQPEVVTITDLARSLFTWSESPAPDELTGSLITSAPRGPLPASVRYMIGQDTANQVYRSIVGWFFLYYGVGEAVLFALLALILRGSGAREVKRRVAWYTAAAVFGAALPAGTFLSGLVPWGQYAHPALWLYGLGFAWAAVIAAAALVGPWRKAPWGPPGFVCAVTLAVIGVDVITGSRLQLGAPFGLSLVEAGRLYGVGNNALGVYAVAGMLTAAWAATAAGGRPLTDPVPDRPERNRAVAAGLVALATVIASGWPGFGAKVGGTVAMVPAFLVLLAAVAGIRITPRRAVLIAVSGLALVAVLAVIDYLVPAIGPSHLGGFVGQVLHGDAGGTLHRKFSSNLHSLTETWYTPVVPVVAIVSGIMLGWPERMRLRTFIVASRIDPLLRPALFTVWLAVVLGWLADDSGVSLAAAALPVALPLAIALVTRTASQTVTGRLADRRANLCAAGQ